MSDDTARLGRMTLGVELVAAGVEAFSGGVLVERARTGLLPPVGVLNDGEESASLNGPNPGRCMTGALFGAT